MAELSEEIKVDFFRVFFFAKKGAPTRKNEEIPGKSLISFWGVDI